MHIHQVQKKQATTTRSCTQSKRQQISRPANFRNQKVTNGPERINNEPNYEGNNNNNYMERRHYKQHSYNYHCSCVCEGSLSTVLSVCCWFCCLLLLLCHVSFKTTTTPSSRVQGDTLYSTHCVLVARGGEDLCLPFFTMTLATRKTTDTLLLFYRVYTAYTYSYKRGSVWGQHTCCQSLMPAQCDDDTSWEWHFIYSELEVCWAFFLCFWFQFQIEY